MELFCWRAKARRQEDAEHVWGTSLAVYANIMISMDNTSQILGDFLLLREAAGPCNCQFEGNKKTASVQNPSLPVAHLTNSVISHFPVFHHQEQHGGL